MKIFLKNGSQCVIIYMRGVVLGIILVCSLIYTNNVYSGEMNIAKGKKVVGNIQNAEILTDGVIDTSRISKTEIQEGKELYTIIVLSSASYIGKISCFFIGGSEKKSELNVFGSKDIMTWDQIIVDRKEIKVLSNDIVRVDYYLANEYNAVFFLKMVFANIKRELQLCEIEAFSLNEKKFNFLSAKAVSVGEHLVTLAFKTDMDVIGTVNYGVTADKLIYNANFIKYDNEHNVKLSDLLKGTTYYVRISALNCFGIKNASDIIKFRTKGEPLPLITDLQIKESYKDAIIKYDSNVNTKFDIYFGDDASNLNKVTYPVFSKMHRLKMYNLYPERDYYFQLRIMDKYGNEKYSELNRFKTREKNVAFMKTVIGTFKYTGENIAPREDKNAGKMITDGNFDFFSGSCMSGNIMKSEQFFIIDLGRVYKLSRVEIYWWHYIYSTDYEISISMDGAKWQTIEKAINPQKVKPVIKKYNGTIGVPIQCKGNEGRFVKCQMKRGIFFRKWPQYSNLRIYEVQVIPVTQEIDKDISVKVLQ